MGRCLLFWMNLFWPGNSLGTLGCNISVSQWNARVVVRSPGLCPGSQVDLLGPGAPVLLVQVQQGLAHLIGLDQSVICSFLVEDFGHFGVFSTKEGPCVDVIHSSVHYNMGHMDSEGAQLPG